MGGYEKRHYNAKPNDMKENKFRGFVEAESRWIYGDLLHSYWHLDGVVYETAIRYKINDGYSYPIPVKPDTVGQFTGLYDKDGREIYENCIINEKYLVVYFFNRYILQDISNKDIFAEIKNDGIYTITQEYAKLAQNQKGLSDKSLWKDEVKKFHND